MVKEIIRLKNCAIEKIETDQDCISEGCPTCGYGAKYCSSITIYFNSDKPKFIQFSYYSSDSFYYQELMEEGLNLGDIIHFFCRNYGKFSNMDKEEFIDFLKTDFNSEGKYEVTEY